MAAPKAISMQVQFEPDAHQREAIEHVHGPMLVVAGAGTGKTSVLTQRVACLILGGHAHPNEILALTYTENAAYEMKSRVGRGLELAGISKSELDGLQIKTFHAYCNNLLIDRGLKFGVLDDKDLWIYLRKRVRELRLNYFVRAANVAKFLEDLLDFMRRSHDELVGPEQYAAYVGRLERGELPIPRVCRSKNTGDLSDEEVVGRCQEIANVFATVERMLKEDNLGTFGHMITRAYAALQNDEALLREQQNCARFILVDEFQDANLAQVKILHRLGGEQKNVFGVGDPDQSIYRFRGASGAAFGLFHRHFSGTKRVRLDKNRRSLSTILNCASALIAENPEPFSATGEQAYLRSPLLSARDEAASLEGIQLPGIPVQVVVLTAKEAECHDLIARIRDERRKSRCDWKQFAILYRMNSHRDEIADELARQGIPFSIENLDVMETPMTRDLFACLGAIVSPTDGISLFRVAALPQFAIDPQKLRAAMKALPRESQAAGMPLVLQQIEGGRAVLQELQETRDRISATGAKGRSALEMIAARFKLDRTSIVLNTVLDFVAKWEEKPTTKTGELPELLEYLDYFREAGGSICLPPSEENAVRLMTAHSAKGLEFHHVFILRASSPSFPAAYKEPLIDFPCELRDADSVANKTDKELNEEEERRLFYVAITRARDSLTIYAKQGTGKKDPSPPGFLRGLLKNSSLKPWLHQTTARGFQTDLFAAAQTTFVPSRLAEWLAMPSASDLSARLSASAVQTYETCPLQFKLQREWRLPQEPAAAMQYGAAMHRVLRIYYDAVRFGRRMSGEELLDALRDDLASAGIQDAYQHDLYQEQAVRQIADFIAACSRAPEPKVLHTEEAFEVKLGTATVVGRIDRIDQMDGNRIVITDYKTGRPQSQEDADKSLQLSIYSLAAREKWGYHAEHLIFFNLEGSEGAVTHRSDAQLEEARCKVESV
ncbi:MAG: ATP-dependent helicase UvrD/PcrA, partial [Acidobacteriaceae bacterium]